MNFRQLMDREFVLLKKEKKWPFSDKDLSIDARRASFLGLSRGFYSMLTTGRNPCGKEVATNIAKRFRVGEKKISLLAEEIVQASLTSFRAYTPNTSRKGKAKKPKGDCSRSDEEASVHGDFLTPDEVASMLRIDPKDALHALQSGEIPGAIKIGNSFCIFSAVIKKWLQRVRDAEMHKISVPPKRRRR